MIRLSSLLFTTFLLTACSTKAHEASLSESKIPEISDFISTLKKQQKQQLHLSFNDEARTHWHYIPKWRRHGLRVSEMSDKQYKQMMAILAMTLSPQGMKKVETVMKMEQILREFEGQHRDPKKYYFTLYGQAGEGKWGYSFEGHHLSLNFTFDGQQMISCTPLFLGANPARIPQHQSTDLKPGSSPLNDAEKLAFDLFNSLNPEQRKLAHQSKIARGDMREGHHSKPQEKGEAQGISWDKLEEKQQQQLLRLIREAYVNNLSKELADQQWQRITAQKQSLRFHFNGQPAVDKKHHYRIKGQSLLILLYNTQNGSQGQAANHIHQLWRDSESDFGLN